MAKRSGRKEKNEAKFRDIAQDISGNVTYTGDLWRIADSQDAGDAGRQRAMLIAGPILIFIIVIGSGCIDAKNAMGAFYVVLPYIGEVSALFALLWNAAKLMMPSGGVRTYTLDRCKGAIPAACRILSIFAAAGLVLSAVYLIINGIGDSPADSIAYLLLKAAAATIAEWYRRLFRSTVWEIFN